MSCDRRTDAGAYALHALEPAEAREFEHHLEGCRECADHVAELAPVVDALPMAAPQVAPPDALKGRIMAVVESEAELLRAAGPEADRPVPAAAPARRRRWFSLAGLRPLPVAAAAACVLAAGVVAGAVLAGGDDGPAGGGTTLEAQAEGGATVHLVMDDEGRAQLVMHGMPAAPEGRVYQVWVARDGQAEATHTLFDVPGDGQARVAIDEDMTGVDEVMVTDEPTGGSEAPTREPVVVARIS